MLSSAIVELSFNAFAIELTPFSPKAYLKTNQVVKKEFTVNTLSRGYPSISKSVAPLLIPATIFTMLFLGLDIFDVFVFSFFFSFQIFSTFSLEPFKSLKKYSC